MAKKSISFKLFYRLLYHDVANKTDLTGRSRDTGQNPEEQANMRVNEDDNVAAQVMRSVTSGLGSLKTALAEYLDESRTYSNDIPLKAPAEDSTDGATIALKMPSNFNTGMTDPIAKHAHDYVVAMAIADWFVITNKADAADYATKAQAHLQQIRQQISKRRAPDVPEIVDEAEDESDPPTPPVPPPPPSTETEDE